MHSEGGGIYLLSTSWGDRRQLLYCGQYCYIIGHNGTYELQRNFLDNTKWCFRQTVWREYSKKNPSYFYLAGLPGLENARLLAQHGSNMSGNPAKKV